MNNKERQNDSFFEESRAYLNTQMALLKLETIERISKITQSILLLLLAIILLGGAFFYLSLGFIWWTKDLLGILPSILIVSGSYLFILFMAYVFRKKWIINPLVRLLSQILFSTTPTPNNDDEE